MLGLPRHQIPNALTVLRAILAAAFFAALAGFTVPDEGRLWGNVALALFILAAITDALDGALARRWNVVSIFGRIMDPFCDKVLVLGAFVALAGARFHDADRDTLFDMATGVYSWMVVVIVARELLVTGIRGVVESMGVTFGSNWSGKAKMILQSITLPLVLFLTVNLDPLANAWVWWTNHVLMGLTLVITVWSGLPYITGARAILARTATSES